MKPNDSLRQCLKEDEIVYKRRAMTRTSEMLQFFIHSEAFFRGEQQQALVFF
jgi:hypothetical protein